MEAQDLTSAGSATLAPASPIMSQIIRQQDSISSLLESVLMLNDKLRIVIVDNGVATEKDVDRPKGSEVFNMLYENSERIDTATRAIRELTINLEV